MSLAVVLLAGLSALVWGSADYCGGKATRRAPALGVTVLAQLCGLPVLVVCLVVLPGRPLPADLLWGAGAGLAGVLGIVLLYTGLSAGAMAVVAPITAVIAAVVPLGFGLALGESPSTLGLFGVACAVAAVGLVSLSPSQGGRATPRVIWLALGSGVLLGLFFVLLAQSSVESGMWSLAGARFGSIALGLALVVRRGVSLRMPRANLVWVALAGIGDIAANAMFLLASRDGLLSVVAPIASLYPVSTVLLALTVDKERVRPIQVAGLGLAATALVLTAI